MSDLFEPQLELNRLREEIAVLTSCRDHWKTSFEHERETVIQLREIVFKFHQDGCICEHCELVREHQ